MFATVRVNEGLKSLAAALLAAADEQTKLDIVATLREPQRRLVTLMHNRSVQLSDPEHLRKAWLKDIENEAW